MLRVLEEIGVDITSRYMEVWNKIDLVEDRELVEQDLMIRQEEHPAILMSCLTKEGHKEFVSTVGDMTTTSMGKQFFTLSYDCAEHNQRIGWLYKHAGITREEAFEYEGDQRHADMIVKELGMGNANSLSTLATPNYFLALFFLSFSHHRLNFASLIIA